MARTRQLTSYWIEETHLDGYRVVVLGALGLVLPGLTGTAEILTPLAATGLALIMVGATITHERRGERQAVPVTVLLVGPVRGRRDLAVRAVPALGAG